jgi:hypothetical protein
MPIVLSYTLAELQAPHEIDLFDPLSNLKEAEIYRAAVISIARKVN